MYLSEEHVTKWSKVLDVEGLPKITDPYRKAVTALVLENQEKAMVSEYNALNGGFGGSMLTEAPVNVVGGGMSPVVGGEGNIKGFDPILISLVRRSMPNLMAYDIAGVQPMTGPTGLIFAMRAQYANTTAFTAEAFFNEVNTAFAGNTATTHTLNSAENFGANTFVANTTVGGTTDVGAGLLTNLAEDLGGGTTFGQMGFTIERVPVSVKTRALKAEYTLELAQDLKAIHGLDAEAELSNILSTEILAEINREVVRIVYGIAKIGVSYATVPGTFNLSAAGDTDGRWAVEKYKTLLYVLEREANQIGKETRRGKGNMVIVSTDVASALAMSGLLDYQGALTNNTNLAVDDNGNTFAGVLFGRTKVFVDPYSVAGSDFVVVGYKGANPYDAGFFYCPYVPLQMVRAINPDTFQPKIGFKTRYGLVANPFAEGTNQGFGRLAPNTNVYYRKFVVSNLK